MPSFRRHILIAALAAVLTACATATPYQPLQNGYGYTDQQLEKNRYRVTFVGNSETPRRTVENYLLYRAARITINHGYDYFVIVNQNTERFTHYINTYQGAGGYYAYNPFFFEPFFSTLGTSYPVNHYHAYATIVLYHGSKPSGNIHAYDARQIIEHLGPQVRKNMKKQGKD